MYHHNLTDILFLAANQNFRFVPAAGPDWKGDFDLGKQPLISIHEATADPAVLTAWAEKYRNCNWLYVPGDGQAVLDVDPRHGGDGVLAELEREHGPLPRTPRVRTGRGDGGSHRHLAVPAGLSFDRDILGNPGLTLACGGKHGFVVPPCRHALGGQYAWEVPPWDADPAPCPGWLLGLARADAPAAAKPPAGSEAAPTPVPPDLGPLEFVWGGGDRLAAHPGSVAKSLGGEGRRPTLVSLLGRELGLGRAADDLEPEVRAWAGRCTPPLDEREALKHLHSMARRDAARHGEERHPHTPTRGNAPAGAGERKNPVAAPAVGPTEGFVPSLAAGGHPILHADALHGLAGELVRAVGPATEADEPAVLLSFLTAFGSAAGFAPRWDHGKPHGANLFVLLVGPTSARKGTAWGVGSAAVRQADPGWAEQRMVAEGFGSGEGLIWPIRDGAAEGKDGVADPGVADKRLLMVEQEFSKALRLARQKESILSAVIRAAFDREPLGKRNKGENAYRATDPHVSIVGHITADELRADLQGSQYVANGLVNRFLICDTRRTKFIPRNGCWPQRVAPLVGRVRAALDRAKGTGLLELDGEAGAVWDGLYAELEARPDTTLGRATGRASDHCMKVALVYALLDGADAIRLPHLTAGLAVWRYCEASARVVFGDAGPGAAGVAPAEEPLAARVLGLIRAEPGVSRTALHERLGNRVKAGALDEALAWLEAQRHAHRRSVSTGGRPAECWWPGPGPDGGANEGSPPPGGGPARDLPSFVWSAPAGATDDQPGDGTDDVPSFAGDGGEPDGDVVCGVVPPGPDLVPHSDKYPDAETLEKAIRARCGSIVKHSDGRCELQLMKPDPGIEAAWRRWGAEIGATYLTETEFYGELEKLRPSHKTP